MDGVVILHGIFRTRRSMAGLARFLKRAGYKVLNIGYPSTRHDLDTLAGHIHPDIERFTRSLDDGVVHFVGYSMGGLLIRAYLKRYRPRNLGRIVMLATPNNGSEVADRLQNWFLYRMLYGPAGQQLGCRSDYIKNLPVLADCEIGIIAGNATLDPICSTIIGKPNDGKVSIESTRLPGMQAHIVLPHTHTFFPHRKSVWEQALAFLRSGSFAEDKAGA